MGILGALPPSADADDSIQIPGRFPASLVSLAHGPEGQTLDFLSSVQGKETPSGSIEQAADTYSPLSSSHGPEGQSLNPPSSAHGKETPPESPAQDVDAPLPPPSAGCLKGQSENSPSLVQSKQTPSDSPEEAVDIVHTTPDQQIKADDVQVLFRAFPEILQHLIDAAMVLEGCDGRTIVALVVIVFTLCFVLYDLCIYTLQDDMMLVQ